MKYTIQTITSLVGSSFNGLYETRKEAIEVMNALPNITGVTYRIEEMRDVITATSHFGGTFYYDTDKKTFVSYDDADLSSDHFDCDVQTLPFAMEIARKEGLQNVQLEDNPEL